MKNTAITSFALFASAVVADYGYDATGVGSAVVVNNCNYPVKLCNVPSSGGGYEEEDTSVAPGGSWSQAWTSLSNGNGWSIKLSKTDSLDHILQYEYTWHQDGIIWYDLSCVNGNPWDNDWEITANGTECSPKQQAYRYSTDDAYGMQSCAQDSIITVTLCTGTSADNGDTANGTAPAPSSSAAASSSAASAPAYEAPSAASPPSYQEPSSSAPSAAAATPYGYNWNNKDASKSEAAQTTPTTLATSVTAVYTNNAGGVTITEIQTVYTTAEVTVYNRHRRHEHSHAHRA